MEEKNSFIQAPSRRHSRTTIPFCTEFLNEEKNWPINKYNSLGFCSNNLGELLHCKPRKLTLLDKQSDDIWHHQGFKVRKQFPEAWDRKPLTDLFQGHQKLFLEIDYDMNKKVLCLVQS